MILMPPMGGRSRDAKMPRTRPLNVEVLRDRHGKLRYYFRIGKGTRLALPVCPFDSPTFQEAYSAAFAGKPIALPPAAMPKSDTIAALIDSYEKSPKYRELAEGSRSAYDSRLA